MSAGLIEQHVAVMRELQQRKNKDHLELSLLASLEALVDTLMEEEGTIQQEYKNNDTAVRNSSRKAAQCV